MGEKKMRVDAIEMKEGCSFSDSLGKLIYFCIEGGARSPGDKVTVIVPSMLVGRTRETAIDTGEWEVTLKKIGD